MEEFLGRMTELGKAEVHLICKEPLVPLYESFGFTYLRPSASAHGGATWHEMARAL